MALFTLSIHVFACARRSLTFSAVAR